MALDKNRTRSCLPFVLGGPNRYSRIKEKTAQYHSPRLAKEGEKKGEVVGLKTCQSINSRGSWNYSVEQGKLLSDVYKTRKRRLFMWKKRLFITKALYREERSGLIV